MDPYAFGQIDGLGRLAEANGITVPCLRGYRLMERERTFSEEELAKGLEEIVGTYWWMDCRECDPEWSDHSEEMYRAGYRPPSIPKGCGQYVWMSDDPEDIRARTVVTSHFQRIGMLKARFKRQYMLWNRYAGQKGVLYIHSRMGGCGITDCDYHDGQGGVMFPEGWDVRDQPWFLDVCADAFDPTYCDIYARVKE